MNVSDCDCVSYSLFLLVWGMCCERLEAEHWILEENKVPHISSGLQKQEPDARHQYFRAFHLTKRREMFKKTRGSII